MSQEKKKPATNKPVKKSTTKKVSQPAKKQPKNKIVRNKITLDATDQSFGRICSKAASILIGKNKPNFEPQADTGDFVVIENGAMIKFTGKKFEDKKYYRHSNFPGGLKSITLGEKFAKSSADTIRDCVNNMLPKNRLQKNRIKRLTVK